MSLLLSLLSAPGVLLLDEDEEEEDDMMPRLSQNISNPRNDVSTTLQNLK